MPKFEQQGQISKNNSTKWFENHIQGNINNESLPLSDIIDDKKSSDSSFCFDNDEKQDNDYNYNHDDNKEWQEVLHIIFHWLSLIEWQVKDKETPQSTKKSYESNQKEDINIKLITGNYVYILSYTH